MNGRRREVRWKKRILFDSDEVDVVGEVGIGELGSWMDG